MEKMDSSLLDQVDAMLQGVKPKKPARTKKEEPWKSTDGLWRVYEGDKVKLLHRVLVEKFIGRSLDRSEVVKFKDGNPDNCVLENLLLVTDKGIDLTKIICSECHKSLM